MTILRSVLPVLAFVLGLAACSAHPKRVDCEAHLQPINAPAPIQKVHEPQS